VKVIGDTGNAGFADGLQPRFNKPIRLAPFGTDADAVVVSDISNHAIRRVHLNGETTTLAGGPDKQGHQDGPAATAKFNSPHGVAFRSRDGAIAVAEASNHTIRLLTPVAPGGPKDYLVSTIAGVPGKSGFQDGPASEALFNSPHAVGWGAKGELYIADIGNARVRMLRDGRVSTVAGTGTAGSADGPLSVGTLNYPMDLALDGQGRVWIIDAATSLVRLLEPGKGLSTPWPGVTLAMPHGVAVPADGRVVVAEMNAHRAVSMTMGSASPTSVFGTGSVGVGVDQLNKPAAVLVHGGHLWIADLYNHRLVVTKW
jgi:streptogramin lyase